MYKLQRTCSENVILCKATTDKQNVTSSANIAIQTHLIGTVLIFRLGYRRRHP
jgi:hypothetical protein